MKAFDGYTSLMLAAQMALRNCRMLVYGAEVNNQDVHNRAAALSSSFALRLLILSTALAKGQSDLQDRRATALMTASLGGHEVVRLLLENGADINLRGWMVQMLSSWHPLTVMPEL